MSMYQTVARVGQKFLGREKLFKYGFNFSPLYRRTTGRVISVSENLMDVKVRIKLSWKNVNYMGAIFGGSLFSATDAIYLVQLTNILGNDYVVWDKSCEIKFKRPAKKTAYASFTYTEEEIADIRKQIEENNEIDLIKNINIVGPDNEVFCELSKVLYIADKQFYKEKKRKKKQVA